jgi:hypothetical protein
MFHCNKIFYNENHLVAIALPDYRVIYNKQQDSLPNKLIGCGEEIHGLAVPMTEGMKGHKNKQQGEV